MATDKLEAPWDRNNSVVWADASEPIAEARRRARQVFSSGLHQEGTDERRRIIASAHDAVILIWISWLGLHGFGDPSFAPYFLVALSFSLALLRGISTARSIYVQVQTYASELARERAELQKNPDREREEVRALYAAKGFREPLLDQIVETIAADDDRLLKVMMEEELGFFMYHVSHPLVVGGWNFLAALGGGLALSLPLIWCTQDQAHGWMPCGGIVLLAVISYWSHRIGDRRFIECFAVAIIMAGITGGTVYLLAQWFALRLTEIAGVGAGSG